MVSLRVTAAGALALLVAGCSPAHQVPVGEVPAGSPLPSFPASAPVEPLPSIAMGVDSLGGSGALRIGPDDLLEITVLEAEELNRSVRVDGAGKISLPLLGEIAAAGRTPRELELQLEADLRQRFIRDPHVSVHLKEMQSQAVSLVGAVARPGVYQIRGARPLLELIALAGGLAPDAGDSVIIVRAGGAGSPSVNAAVATEGRAISLRALLESADPQHNVLIHSGDVVKVRQAGVIYVVGEVRRPGAFQLEHRAGLTVLQAIALGQGLAPSAAKGRTMIIRTGPQGERIEMPVDLGAVLAGRAIDTELLPQDVVFVPSSTTRAVALGAVDALVRMVSLRGIF